MTDFTDYELDVIHKVLGDELWRTGLGFDNSDLSTNPETAAKVATMYVIVNKIENRS